MRIDEGLGKRVSCEYKGEKRRMEELRLQLGTIIVVLVIDHEIIAYLPSHTLRPIWDRITRTALTTAVMAKRAS